MSAEQTPLTVDAALVRLGQYREHAITWSTASYNDDTERALYRIAEALAAEIERLRAEVAGRVSVETAEAIWRAGVIAGDDAYEPTGRPSRAAVLREAAQVLEEDDYLLAADELREMADEADQAAGPAVPTPLRWGLDDVELGDDGSVTLMLSGPHGEPYVLDLDPARAVALSVPITEHAQPYAQAAVDTSPCSFPECNVDGTGEPCDRHEREQAHAEGEHNLCGPECAAWRTLDLTGDAAERGETQ